MQVLLCVGMGSRLINKEIVENQDYSKLENMVREALEIIQKVRTI
jgi:2-dehydro-3-deoxyphosphogluconate aldolase/(4S)-4-hydroxy-2-oxoglutarate aldolase